jgi:hypothetical protein
MRLTLLMNLPDEVDPATVQWPTEGLQFSSPLGHGAGFFTVAADEGFCPPSSGGHRASFSARHAMPHARARQSAWTD